MVIPVETEAVEKINSVKTLNNIIYEKRNDNSWSKLIGYYYKVTQSKSEDITEHMNALNSLNKSLTKKGYKLSREVIISLLDELPEDRW